MRIGSLFLGAGNDLQPSPDLSRLGLGAGSLFLGAGENMRPSPDLSRFGFGCEVHVWVEGLGFGQCGFHYS